MTVATIFAGTNDGNIRSNNATYLTARSGGTFVVSTTGLTSITGQELYLGNYYCYESFFEFDTSGIPANATISSAVLSLRHQSKSGTWIARAYKYDWGATVTSADWVPGANLSGLPLLAHIASADVVTGAYNAYVDDAFPANVVKAGLTRIVVTTDKLEAATVPTGAEYTYLHMADITGTTEDPKLVITYTTPAGGSQVVIV